MQCNKLVREIGKKQGKINLIKNQQNGWHPKLNYWGGFFRGELTELFTGLFGGGQKRAPPNNPGELFGNGYCRFWSLNYQSSFN